MHDQRGFTLLYDNYSAALYGIILRIVRVEEIAADVLQDAFVKIWLNLEAYSQQKGSLFTWMLNIARNTAIDRLRSKEHHQSLYTQSYDGQVGPIDQAEKIEMKVDASYVRTQVDLLRPEYRKIVDLLYYQGFTQAQAAKELGIPLGTVKTRMKAAMVQLQVSVW